MAMSDMLKKKIAEASASGGGNPIKDGRYTFAVNAIKCEEKYKGVCFIVELKVIASEAVRDDVKPNAVGTTCGVVWNFTKHPDTAPGNTKGFLCTLEGVDPSGVTKNEMDLLLDQATDASQPYRGYLVKCETFRKWTKDNKTELTLPRWEHVPGQTDESVAAQRAVLDKAS